MKLTWLAGLGAMALPAVAQAHWHNGFGLSLGISRYCYPSYGYRYAAPRYYYPPVVTYYAPPPVVYSDPAPVYAAPYPQQPPVVYAPAPTYYAPPPVVYSDPGPYFSVGIYGGGSYYGRDRYGHYRR